jgi:hypothetical protein
MQLFSWLHKRMTGRPRTGRTPARQPKRRFRPQLEALEDRWLPSTLTVLNNLDSGPGSLRADIAAAKSKDTIVFAPSLNGQTINLTSGELVINKNLTIQGPGAGQLAISQPFGAYTVTVGFRIFEVDGVTATIAGLTISNGYAPLNGSPTYGGGAGILNWGGNLTVSNCTLSNNYAASGGAIANFGTLTVNGCTLSGNHLIGTSTTGGPGGGGIYNAYACSATVSNTTISGNGQTSVGYGWGSYNGGGIYNSGWMTLSGTTVTNNSADWGGGIYEDTNASLSIIHNSNVSGNHGEDLFLAHGASPVKISADSYVGG